MSPPFEYRCLRYSDVEPIDLGAVDDIDGYIWISENPGLRTIRIDARRIRGF